MSLQRILAVQLAQPDAGERDLAAELGEAALTRVFVRDLVLDGHIGVYAHEQAQRQRIRFNVDLYVRLPKGGPRRDSLDEVLSYEDVVNGIRGLLAEGHVNLVETLAEQVAALVLKDPRVALARVRVEKLDVVPGAAVGVEIERRPPAAPAEVQPLLRVLSGA
ncbi:MAG: dihydroneopterin aldolase [Alphaproteobacteria bacterium]|nr:dihydroneopterin aldolase [Alphaproteobacteria bacterium]